MNKQELLKLISDMPDNLFCEPLEISEAEEQCEPWVPAKTQLVGQYDRKVNNSIKLKLRFTTEYTGHFKRTYENPEGAFSNVRRIS
jgi:hypothetical protein